MATFLMTLLINKFTSIVMDDPKLDGKFLSKWQFMQHCKSLMPKLLYKEWQIMLGHIKAGDTTQAIYD
jgi:hypothetical protein